MEILHTKDDTFPMKKLALILGSLFVLIVIAVIGVYVSRDTIATSILKSTIEKEFPGSSTEIGQLQTEVGNTLSFEITNLKILRAGRPALTLALLRVDLPEILTKKLEGSADVKLTGLKVNMNEFNALVSAREKESPKKDEPKSDKPFDPKELKDIAKFEVNLDVKNIEVESEENGVLTKVELPEFMLKKASLSSNFPLRAKVLLSQMSEGKNLNFVITQNGQIDASEFLTKEKLKPALSWNGKGKMNDKPLPALTATFDGELDLKGASELNFIAHVSETNLEARISANMKEKTFETKVLRALIIPGQFIELDKNLRAELNGTVKGTFDHATGDMKLTTTAFQLPREEKEPVSIDASTTEIHFDVATKGKSEIDLDSKYATSRLIGHLELMDAKPITVTVNSQAFAKDLSSLLSQVLTDLTLKKNESKVALKADVDLTKEPIQAQVSANNEGDFILTNAEGHMVVLKKLTLSSTPDADLQKVTAVMEGSLTPAKLKPVPFHTELNADIKAKDVKGSFVFETVEDSSVARANFSAGENSFNLTDLKGKIIIAEFLPLLPAETRAMFSPAPPKSTGMILDGNLAYADGKVKNSKLSVHLSQPLTLKKEENTIVVEKLSLDSVPAKSSDVLALKIALAASMMNSPITHDSFIEVDLARTNKEKAPAVSSTHSTKLFKDSSLAFKVTMERRVTTLSDLKGTIHLQELYPLVPKESRAQLAPLKTTKAQLKLAGTVALKEKTIKKLDITMGTSSPVPMNALEGVPAEASFEAKIDQSNTNFSAKMTLLQGQMSFSAKGPSPKSTDVANPMELLPKLVKVKIDGLQVPRSLLQKILHPKDQSAPTAPVVTERKEADFTTLTKIKELDLEIEPGKITIEKKPFGLAGSINIKRGQLKTKNLKLTQDQGSVAVDLSAKFQPKSMEAKLHTEISKFELGSLSGFLPPIVEAVTGKANGSISADARMSGKNPPAYDARYSIKVLDGELKKIKLTEQIGAILNKVPFMKKDKEVAYSDKFKEFSARGNADEKLIILDELTFSGLQNSLSMKGKGKIGQMGSKQKSELVLELTDPAGKIGAALKENTDSNVLPLRLAGSEIDLKPDYEYTLSRVGKGAAKKVIEKKGKEILGDFLKKKGFKL